MRAKLCNLPFRIGVSEQTYVKAQIGPRELENICFNCSVPSCMVGYLDEVPLFVDGLTISFLVRPL